MSCKSCLVCLDAPALLCVAERLLCQDQKYPIQECDRDRFMEQIHRLDFSWKLL